jgi:hypothetical protein
MGLTLSQVGPVAMHASLTGPRISTYQGDMLSSAADGVHAGGQQQGAGPWQCSHCTFLNDAAAASCEMCHKSQGAAPSTSDGVLEVRALHSLYYTEQTFGTVP